MITTTTKYQQTRIELASVDFFHSGYTDVHIEKMYKSIDNHDKNRLIVVALNATFKKGSEKASYLQVCEWER